MDAFPDPLPVFSQGVSISGSQLSPTHLSPAAVTLWLGPQRVSPGRELSSRLCPVTLGKRFDFSDSGFAPLKTKSLARTPSRVPALPVLALGREALLSVR